MQTCKGAFFILSPVGCDDDDDVDIGPYILSLLVSLHIFLFVSISPFHPSFLRGRDTSRPRCWFTTAELTKPTPHSPTPPLATDMFQRFLLKEENRLLTTKAEGLKEAVAKAAELEKECEELREDLKEASAQLQVWCD